MEYSCSANDIPESIDQIIFAGFESEWQMTAAERCALIMLLEKIKPECAIEIGTAQGGSLSVLSHFAKKVYTLDVDPTCHERLGHKFANTEFITGRSQETLLPLLKRLQESGTPIGFILIDGDHSTEGLRQDIELVISIQPTQPLFIVMHDSFNSDCRSGIFQADWGSSPYVHFVEVDFVPGIFHSKPDIFRQMWGGLSLAIMLPEKRIKDLQIQASQELLFQTVLPHSILENLPWFQVPSCDGKIPLDYQIAGQLLTRMRTLKIFQYAQKHQSIRESLKRALLKFQAFLALILG